MSLEPVADGELAAIVTYLEMTRPPASPPGQSQAIRLERWERPSVQRYRDLFRMVGAPWLWFSRLMMTDETLAGIIEDKEVEIYRVRAASGEEVGILELDFRHPGECEIAFIGLVPELSGKGHGKWLLAQALQRAWREGVARVHVHTCSLDHPAALPAYRRAGMIPYKRAIERFPDPRLLGILGKDCAPQIPLLGTDG
ncbi:MAG TPA: GNAT family protein [Sphingomicrobium sp.]|nr:GNAT family protein [Sphingomicrobium sp.]